MGSQQPSSAAPAPQQELPPACTRSAAWPYFSLTTSFNSIGPHLQRRTIACGSTALLRVQHSAYRKPRSSWRVSALAEYQRYVPSRRTLTSPSFLSLSRWWESVDAGIPSSL